MKKSIATICSLAVVAVLSIASLTTGAFAADVTTQSNTTPPSQNEQRQKPGSMSSENFKTMLAKLVTDGTITQSQADEAYSLATADDAAKVDFSKIPDAVKEAMKPTSSHTEDETSTTIKTHSWCDGLTDDQNSKITQAVDESFKTAIAALVSDGTLTQDQADKIIASKENKKGMQMGGHEFNHTKTQSEDDTSSVS